jgi:hypothetical protein
MSPVRGFLEIPHFAKRATAGEGREKLSAECEPPEALFRALNLKQRDGG